DRVIALLAQRGRFAWLDVPGDSDSRCTTADRLCPLLSNLPWDGPAVSRAVKRLKQVACRKGVGDLRYGNLVPRASCALAGMAEVVAVYEALGRLYSPEHREWLRADGPFLTGWAQRLQMAWLRDRDARPLARALTSDTPGLAEVLAELATREIVPGLAP